MKTALVLVWTGPWKPWINLYVETCRRNPDFDFLIFTDQPPPAAAAPNVRFIPISLDAFARRAEAVMGFPISIGRGYKLCDYKPAFGELFAAELQPYSYWGYCDEDILWGRIGRFVPPALVAAHDIVTSCRCCLVGQLTLLRNAPGPNTLYRRVPGWREILQEPGTVNLAETILDTQARAEEARGQLKVWRGQIQIADLPDEAWDLWANRLELAEHGRRHPRLPAGPVVWRDGAIHDAAGKNEYAFFHFKNWKKTAPLPFVPPPPADLAEWCFTAEGVRFVPAPDASASTLDFVLTHNRATAEARRRLARARWVAAVCAPWHRARNALSRRLRS